MRSRNHCCRGKAISIKYSVCVSIALVIQHAKRMRRIILSSVACLALPYFSTFSQTVRFSEINYLIQNVCSDCLYIFETCPII
jgi:hypothetical protein